jgi:hypothetical protein
MGDGPDVSTCPTISIKGKPKGTKKLSLEGAMMHRSPSIHHIPQDRASSLNSVPQSSVVLSSQKLSTGMITPDDESPNVQEEDTIIILQSDSVPVGKSLKKVRFAEDDIVPAEHEHRGRRLMHFSPHLDYSNTRAFTGEKMALRVFLKYSLDGSFKAFIDGISDSETIRTLIKFVADAIGAADHWNEVLDWTSVRMFDTAILRSIVLQCLDQLDFTAMLSTLRQLRSQDQGCNHSNGVRIIQEFGVKLSLFKDHAGPGLLDWDDMIELNTLANLVDSLYVFPITSWFWVENSYHIDIQADRISTKTRVQYSCYVAVELLARIGCAIEKDKNEEEKLDQNDEGRWWFTPGDLLKKIDHYMIHWIEECYRLTQVWDEHEGQHWDLCSVYLSLTTHRQNLSPAVREKFFRCSIKRMKVLVSQLEFRPMIEPGKDITDHSPKYAYFDMRNIKSYSHHSDPQANMEKRVAAYDFKKIKSEGSEGSEGRESKMALKRRSDEIDGQQSKVQMRKHRKIEKQPAKGKEYENSQLERLPELEQKSSKVVVKKESE